MSADDVQRAAGTLRVSVSEVAAALAADPTLRVDDCGNPFYVEPIDDQRTSTAALSPDDAALGAEVGKQEPDPFNLSSRPGAPRTLYVRFNGGTLTGSAWNTYAGAGTITVQTFDTDGDPSTFAPSEVQAMRAVWAFLAEDFAPFNINVTTKQPSADALLRADKYDTRFGTTVWIGQESAVQAACKCLGVAYVGGVNHLGPALQTVWLFNQTLAGDARRIAAGAAHEAGHFFGLKHDGIPGDEYYDGHNGWSPIMGGSDFALTQWSKGEYPNANNTEDDLAVMASNGLPPAVDDYPNTAATAGSVALLPVPGGTYARRNGVIASGDIDAFKVTLPGPSTISLAPAPALGANLDAHLRIVTGAGTPVYESNELMAPLPGLKASGVGATATIAAAGTYVLLVSGEGRGTLADGYSAYGSLGRYRLEVLTGTGAPPAALAINSATPGRVALAQSSSLPVAATGGVAPYTWALAAGAPVGWRIGADGVLVGTATSASVTVPVSVTDKVGTRVVANVTLEAAEAPTMTLPSSVATVVDLPTTISPTTTGGSTPYVYSLSSGALPPGLALDPSTGALSGTPTTAGSYRAVLKATDATGRAGANSLRAVTFTVNPPAAIVTPATSALTAGKPVNLYLKASGGVAPYSWYVASGSLPAGLTLSAAGQLSGTPQVASAFTAVLGVKPTKGADARLSWTATVTEPAPVVIATSTISPGTVGTAFSRLLSVSGGIAPYSCAVASAGTLPPGVALSAAGRFTGTPTQKGTYLFSVTCSAARGTPATKALSLTIG